MYYVYVLRSERDDGLYIGCTNNLKKRLALHNAQRVFSTRNRTPLKFIYCEAMLDKRDAFKREKWLKTGWGRNQLQKIISNFLANS